MIYQIIADAVVLIHFIWIVFVIIGFVLTLCGLLWKRYFDFFLFRTVHLCGILYVSLLALAGKYCPLTIVENFMRGQYNPPDTYHGSFIGHYIEQLVYPNVPAHYIIIPTIGVAVFTLTMYIIKPPSKIQKLFKK